MFRATKIHHQEFNCKIQAYGTCHYGESVCRYTAVKTVLWLGRCILLVLNFNEGTGTFIVAGEKLFHKKVFCAIILYSCIVDSGL
jgi:hypothetical protein